MTIPPESLFPNLPPADPNAENGVYVAKVIDSIDFTPDLSKKAVESAKEHQLKNPGTSVASIDEFLKEFEEKGHDPHAPILVIDSCSPEAIKEMEAEKKRPKCDSCRNKARFRVKYKPVARAKAVKVTVCGGCLARIIKDHGAERVTHKEIE